MQLVARSIGDSAHLGFIGAAGCSLGAFLLALTLDESLPPSKVKKITSFSKLANPFSFFAFFCQSKGLAGMGGLLAGWQLAGRKMLPIKNYQKLRFGWGVRQQANFAVIFQLSELIKPLLLPTMVKTVGGGNLQTVAKTDRCVDALIWLLHAMSPMGNYVAAVLQALQHGDACVEKVIATEAERVGCGQGEMYAAQQNVEFVARAVMPWVYGELFARAVRNYARTRQLSIATHRSDRCFARQVSYKEAGGTGLLAFVGLPFVLATVLDLCTAHIAVPLAWSCLGFDPTWRTSGASPQSRGSTLVKAVGQKRDRPRTVELYDRQRGEAWEQLPMVQYYAAQDATRHAIREPDMLQVYLCTVNRRCSARFDMVAYYSDVGKEPLLFETYGRLGDDCDCDAMAMR